MAAIICTIAAGRGVQKNVFRSNTGVNHMLSTIFAGTALLLSLLACLLAVFSVRRSETARLRRVEQKMAEWDGYLAELAVHQEKVHHSLKKLQSRVTMRGNRNAAKSEEPDPRTQPEEWKREMMRQYPMGAWSAKGGSN